VKTLICHCALSTVPRYIDDQNWVNDWYLMATFPDNSIAATCPSARRASLALASIPPRLPMTFPRLNMWS
jgi:hypothetical protein